MQLEILLISLATLASTFLGGLFALKFKDKLHLILGFSAGAVIGVALFDLLPEAIDLGNGFYGVSSITSIVALGFVCYMILDRLFSMHAHDECEDGASGHRGRLGAGSLSVHSFLDGLAIGLAFKISSSVGLIVTTAVLVHDFSDGINTINLILKNNGSKKEAFRWLFVDAIAPVAGVLSTLFFSLSKNFLSLVLAVFCGFFLYIGASDLLPESHHNHPTYLTTLMTILGMAVLFVAVRLVSF